MRKNKYKIYHLNFLYENNILKDNLTATIWYFIDFNKMDLISMDHYT